MLLKINSNSWIKRSNIHKCVIHKHDSSLCLWPYESLHTLSFGPWLMLHSTFDFFKFANFKFERKRKVLAISKSGLVTSQKLIVSRAAMTAYIYQNILFDSFRRKGWSNLLINLTTSLNLWKLIFILHIVCLSPLNQHTFINFYVCSGSRCRPTLRTMTRNCGTKSSHRK